MGISGREEGKGLPDVEKSLPDSAELKAELQQTCFIKVNCFCSHQHSSLKNTLNIEQYNYVQQDSQAIIYHGYGVTKTERTYERREFSEKIVGII